LISGGDQEFTDGNPVRLSSNRLRFLLQMTSCRRFVALTGLTAR
jgi:hypothetical protein